MPTDAPPNSPKPKQPSGAQNRKARKERDAKRTAGTAVDSYLSANAWGQLNYNQVQAQWDPNGPPVELPIFGQPPTTLVKAVSAAILQLEQGAFYAAAYLWDGMLRDDRVSSTIGVRINRLVGSPCELLPAIDDEDEEEEQEEKGQPDEGDDPEKEALDVDMAKRVAIDCERDISRIMPSHQLYELMRMGLGLSVGIAQITSSRSNRKTNPTFQVWNNRYLRFDWLLRCYRLVTENRGEISIETGDPEWIVYEPYGPHGWLHGALIRGLAQPWLIRYWTRTWWARYCEVHGQPLRLGIIPSQRDPADERTFLSQLSNLAHEAVIRLPRTGDADKEGFDVKLLEANYNTFQGFQELLKHCDDSISILFLGQKQSTDGQGGLGSQENAGESTMVRITRKDALVSEVLRDQLLKPWAKANYGNEELAPYIKWETEPPEDESKAAAVDLQVAQALVAFKSAGAPIDIRHYLSDRGYPLISEDEEKQNAIDKQAQEQTKADQAHANAMELMATKSTVKPGDKDAE